MTWFSMALLRGSLRLLLLCVFVMLGFYAWPGAAKAQGLNGETAVLLTPNERSWLAAHPEIRLAPDWHYEPIEYFDAQGKHRGLTADYVELLEHRLGFRFQVVQIPKEKRELKKPALIGTDAIPVSADTPLRREHWLFTNAYLDFPAYVITRKEALDALTLTDLRGARVAVVADYALEEFIATNFPAVRLDRVADTATGLRKVSFGLVDAFVSDLPVATYWMEREGLANLKLAGETGYIYHLGFSVRKDWPELIPILEKGLASITADERTAIYRKWVKMPAAVSSFSHRLGVALSGGLGLAALGLLLVFGWNRSLAAQVKQRTAALQQELQVRKQAEQQLRASEERFATVFRASPSPLGIARVADGEILDVNDRWVHLSGYQRGDLVGQRAMDTELWADLKQHKQIIRQLREQQQVEDAEISYRTKSGFCRTGLLSVTPLQLGGEQCHLWALHDFTERKLAEDALQQSEALFRSLTESTSAWVLITQGTYLRYCNPTAEVITGFSREEWEGKEIWKFIHPDDHQAIHDRIYARKHNLPLAPTFELRFMTSTGELRWLQLSTTSIAYRGGTAELSTAFDITDRKRAEAALQASEELFRSLTESTQALVYIIQGTRFCYANKTVEEQLGYTREEILTVEFFSILHPDDQQRIRARVKAREAGEVVATDTEVRVFTKTGEIRWLQVSSKAIIYQNAPAVLGTAFDITERKKTEEALQQSEVMFRSLAETTPAWVYIIQRGRLCYVNSAAVEGTGYSAEDLRSRDLRVLTHPDDWQMIQERQRARNQGRSGALIFEARAITKSGEVKWFQVASKLIEYNGHAAELCNAIDITERRQAQEALQQSEALFRSLTETTTAWVFVVQNGRIGYINSAGQTGSEYSSQELVGMRVWVLTHPDDLEMVQALHRESRNGAITPLTYEHRVLTKNGKVLWLQFVTNPITYQGAPATLCTAIDITERKEAEEQLRVSEQQLHQLAGYLQTVREEERTAIAREIHDELGQSLTVMKMDLGWLNNKQSEAPTAVRERIVEMIGLTDTTINTVRKIATQLRPGILDDLGLTAALEWQAQEFQNRTGIACEYEEVTEIPDLEPERATAIFRICQESLTNIARHAQATSVVIRVQIDQNQLILEVRDNGIGVDEAELANRRSLGLLGMRERAFHFGGTFQVSGTPTNGTTVRTQIPLPLAKALGGAS